MKTSKKLLVAGLAVTTFASAGLFAQGAFAHTGNDGLVERLATKFNLDQTEVKSVVDEFRKEKGVEHEAKFNAKLELAVKEGKLTAEQKNQIIIKHEEVKNKLDTIKAIADKTERKQAVEQLKSDLKKWAQENDIPERWLHFAGRTHHHKE